MNLGTYFHMQWKQKINAKISATHTWKCTRRYLLDIHLFYRHLIFLTCKPYDYYPTLRFVKKSEFKFINHSSVGYSATDLYPEKYLVNVSNILLFVLQIRLTLENNIEGHHPLSFK